MRKVCVVTGGRADYGLLSVPMMLIRDDPDLELQVVATGQHLDLGSESSLAAIEADGIILHERVDMGLEGDSAAAITKAMGRALIGFAEVFERLKPDLLLILGDRYEIMAAAEAALIARIPILHVAGGDVTEGAIDDSIRHAILKMAHIHCVSTEGARRRLEQLGEASSRIHVTGSPGLDRVRLTPPLDREAFFQAIGFPPRKRNLIVTFHPVTAEGGSVAQCTALLEALDALGPEVGLIFTGVNADVEGRSLSRLIEEFVERRENSCLHISPGPKRYFSALRHVDAVVGNSSSGLYEAPSFGLPTVNIGSRQKGRERAASVIDCSPHPDAILGAIRDALSRGRRPVTNPYGDGHAAERILTAIKTAGDPHSLLIKQFVDR